MQTILQGLSTAPGVLGGIIADNRNNILANSLPPVFDEITLKTVVSIMNDNVIGLEDATGGVNLFDIRSELGRIYIKVMPKMILALLCEQTLNAQLLQISLNVASKKLEQMLA